MHDIGSKERPGAELDDSTRRNRRNSLMGLSTLRLERRASNLNAGPRAHPFHPTDDVGYCVRLGDLVLSVEINTSRSLIALEDMNWGRAVERRQVSTTPIGHLANSF